jgi:type IV secretion system protein VirB11
MEYGISVLTHMLHPIGRFRTDPAVTEIVCQRPGEVGVERASRWEWHHIPEFDERRLDAIGIVAGNLLSKLFDAEHPVCLTALPGERKQRATFVRDPIVAFPSFTIRIPSAHQGSTRDERFQAAFDEPMDAEGQDTELLRLYHARKMGEFFARAVRGKQNIAAIGETGHGKTHFLRTTMADIPDDDRLVTIEDTAEFGPLHLRNRVEMIFGSAGITAGDLVEISLRQRPDRIAVQELRGREIWAYMRILAAGYRGSFTSWHAPREEPFAALVLMAKQTAEGQAMDARDMEAAFRRNIDIVVHCHKNRVTDTYSNKIVWFKGHPLHA